MTSPKKKAVGYDGNGKVVDLKAEARIWAYFAEKRKKMTPEQLRAEEKTSTRMADEIDAEWQAKLAEGKELGLEGVALGAYISKY